MNYKLKGINAEEIRYQINPIENSKKVTQETPIFSRKISRSTKDDSEMLIVLSAKIESTPTNPKVFDLFVSFVACYEVYDMVSDKDLEEFVSQATREIYHYVRNAVISITSSANVFSVILPINPPYFPINNKLQ